MAIATIGLIFQNLNQGVKASPICEIATASLTLTANTPRSYTIDTKKGSWLGVWVSSTTALNQFKIKGKIGNSTLITFTDLSAHYTTPTANSLLIGCSGDLTALAGNTAGWLLFDTRFLSTVEIELASNASGTVTLHTSFKS